MAEMAFVHAIDNNVEAAYRRKTFWNNVAPLWRHALPTAEAEAKRHPSLIVFGRTSRATL